MDMMFALVYVAPDVTLLQVLWTFALVSMMPAFGWILRAPKRRRFAFALIVAIGLSTAAAGAVSWDPPTWCCQDLVAYGICWLPWWC